MNVKRNDPCPCGSGKKYKKCCLQPTIGLTGPDLLGLVQQLQTQTDEFARQHYGEAASLAAWNDFSRWGQAAIACDEQAYQSTFSAWYLFAWLPDDSALQGQQFSTEASDNAIALDYLKIHKEKLSPVERSLIEAAALSPYSFYTVLSVMSDSHCQLKEIYTGKVIIVEGVATNTYTEGDVLFSAVLTVNGVSVLLGCMPNKLAANCLVKLEAHREKWQAEEGKAIDRRLLYLHDTELRRYYFILLAQVQQAQLH